VAAGSLKEKLMGKTKAELVAEAKEKGIRVPEKATKGDLIRLLATSQRCMTCGKPADHIHGGV
jgi:hypothetical protein